MIWGISIPQLFLSLLSGLFGSWLGYFFRAKLEREKIFNESVKDVKKQIRQLCDKAAAYFATPYRSREDASQDEVIIMADSQRLSSDLHDMRVDNNIFFDDYFLGEIEDLHNSIMCPPFREKSGEIFSVDDAIIIQIRESEKRLLSKVRKYVRAQSG